MVNVGFGEYVPIGEDVTRWVARVIFLDKIRDCAPEVLEYLDKNLFPLLIEGRLNDLGEIELDQLWGTLKTLKPEEMMEIVNRPHFYPSYSIDEKIEWISICRELKEWQSQFHLDHFPWILERAFFTLKKWSSVHEDRLKRRWHYGRVHFPEPDAQPFTIAIRGYEPSSMLKSKFVKNAKSAFEKALADHISAAEKNLEESGNYTKTKKKHSEDHFEWLVRLQVQKWTLKKIRSHYHLNSEQTVSKGIRGAENLLGVKTQRQGGKNRSTFIVRGKS